MEASELFTVASDILVVAHDCLPDDRREQYDQVVTVGEPAIGSCCDTMAAWVDVIEPYQLEPAPGNANTPMPRGPITWSATVQLDVYHCIPTADDRGYDPDNGEVSANSLEIHTDVFTILRELYRARNDETLFSNCPACRVAEPPTAKALQTSGSCGGYRITMKVQVT